MSEDDPRYSDAEIEDEEEPDTKSIASSVAGSQILQGRLKRTGSNRSGAEGSSLTEAEKAMIAAKKRHEEEEVALIHDYEARRRAEREKEEEELRMLKEKQEQRRVQREEEEREMAERRRQEEERRKIEEDERRARLEADRLRKEEAKRLKGQLVGSPFASTPPVGTGGRNFILPDKKEKSATSDKFGNIVQAKQEMGMTKEQQDAAKTSFLHSVMRTLQLTGLFGVDLKGKIKELHHRICKLEADKFDLEKRHERQEYDLKELNERQRQMNRNRNRNKKGVDTADSTRYPPKVSVVSKYDRQIDRRNFHERRAMFDKKDAYPCFPNVPPPPALMERTVMPGEKSPIGGLPNGGSQFQQEEEEEDE